MPFQATTMKTMNVNFVLGRGYECGKEKRECGWGGEYLNILFLIKTNLVSQITDLITRMSTTVSPEVVEFFDKVKEQERQFLELVSAAPKPVDPRWQAISRTHIQEGTMALMKSVEEK